MRTHTRKLKRGGRRNGTNTGATSATPATTTTTSQTNSSTQATTSQYNESSLRLASPEINSRGNKVHYKYYAYLPKVFINKYKNQTKRNNLMKERFVVHITFNDNNSEETITLTNHINKQLQKEKKPLISGKVYEVGIINTIKQPLRNSPNKGTFVTNANIGNTGNTLFPSDVLTGTPPLLKKNYADRYFFKKGVGIQSLVDAMDDLKRKGVHYVTLVPMNSKLESLYSGIGFIPVDKVKHTLSESVGGPYANLYYGGPESSQFISPQSPQGEATGRAMYKKL